MIPFNLIMITMAIPNEEGDGYTKEVIRVQYEWKPPHSGDCKNFKHDLLQCPKHVDETVFNHPSKVGTSTSTDTSSDGFMEVTRKKNKDFESDDEVDEVIFSESNKWDDQFDIRLKGRVRI
ncbi:hypothetical protein Tco_0186091 [Tanacetum coccineum]